MTGGGEGPKNLQLLIKKDEMNTKEKHKLLWFQMKAQNLNVSMYCLQLVFSFPTKNDAIVKCFVTENTEVTEIGSLQVHRKERGRREGGREGGGRRDGGRERWTNQFFRTNGATGHTRCHRLPHA